MCKMSCMGSCSKLAWCVAQQPITECVSAVVKSSSHWTVSAFLKLHKILTAGLHYVLAYTRQFWCDVKPSQSTCCHPCRCQGKPMPQPSLVGIGFILKCADMQLAATLPLSYLQRHSWECGWLFWNFSKGFFQDFSKGFPEENCKTTGKGWRIRTFECRIQIPVPYLLSTPQWLSETFE